MSDFLKYLDEHYFNLLASGLRSFVIGNKDELILDRFGLSGAFEITIEFLNLKSCSIEDKGGSLIEFDVGCEPEVGFTGYHSRGGYEEENCFHDKWFTITCRCRIGKDSLYDFRVLYVDFYNRNKKERPLTDEFIPIIESKDYERYAQRILSEFRMDQDRVDLYELAKRMGFCVVNRRIDKDYSIFI